jgi:hypothetical protein
MSHQEPDSQVDFISDTDKAKEEGVDTPVINCKNCFHGDVCYWYTQLFVLEGGMKEAKGIKVKLPFDASILATNCNGFITKRGVEAPPPEVTQDPKDLEEVPETSEE